MIKQAERTESILHTAIDRAATFAASIAKAVVTLVCLGASVSYRAGIKAREIFDTHNAARPDANSGASTKQEVNVPVDNEHTEPQPQQIDNTLTDTITTTEQIVKP